MMNKQLFALPLLATLISSATLANDDDKPTENSQDGASHPPPMQRVIITGEREPDPEIRVLKYSGAGLSGVGLPQLRVEGGGVGAGQKQNPAADNNSSTNDCQNPQSGNPVILASGEKIRVEHDIVAYGKSALDLDRTYKSFSNYVGLFGSKWHSTYDYPPLTTSGCQTDPDYPNECIPTSVVMTLPDGSSYTYTANKPFDYTYKVKNAASMGTMTYIPHNSYQVDTASASFRYSAARVITSVSTPGDGGMLFFTYPSLNTSSPSRVSRASGQAINFTYSNGYVSKVVDQDGNEWSYQYANGHLASVTSPGASPDIRTYYYESPYDSGLLTGIAINGVRYSTYSYYPDKRVQVSSLSGGEVNDSFTYSTNSTTLTNVSGESTTYNFVPVQGALKVSSISRSATSTCAASTAATVYDANGWVDYTLDWNGNKDDYTYDLTGKLLQLTKAVGTPSASTIVNAWQGDNLTSATYKGAAGIAYQSVAYSYVTTGFGINHVASEILTDLTTGTQRQKTYGYTFQSNGLLDTITVTRTLPGDTATTTYKYDTAGNLASVTDALGHQVSYSNYNGRGFAGRVTDANGVVTDFAWDPKSNLTSFTQDVGGANLTTSYTYNNARQVTDIAYPDGRVERFRYNAALRPEYVGNAAGELVHVAFDVASNKWSTSSDRDVPGTNGSTPVATRTGQFIATKQMDSLGRLAASIGNNGQRVSYTYDNNGNVKSVTDAAQHVRSYEYDALNRLVKTTAPDGGVTQQIYNTEGRLQAVIDPRGLQTTYGYDGLGDVTSVVSPDTGTTTYNYDSAGRLAKATYADGRVISYSWDKLSRPLSHCSSSQCDTFTYDEGTYGTGRRTGFSDATGKTAYTYDAVGHIVRQTNTIYGSVYNTTWSYDSSGRLQSMTYPTGLVLNYSYDAYGRQSTVKSNSPLPQ